MLSTTCPKYIILLMIHITDENDRPYHLQINICHYSITGLFVKGKTHLPGRCPCCEVAVLPLNGPARLRGLILPAFGSRITNQGY